MAAQKQVRAPVSVTNDRGRTTSHRGEPRSSTEAEIRARFAGHGVTGGFYASDLATGSEIEVDADTPVVLASVFKIPVMLEYARQCAHGVLSSTERVRVTSSDRVLGPTGLSTLIDDVELSLRDLATLMMTVSDNTATDLLLGRVGIDAVNATLRGLGLTDTEVVGDCREIFRTLAEDLAITDAAQLPMVALERIAAARALDPVRGSHSTPREMAMLLRLIWEDQAGPLNACEEVRRIMRLQVWQHRLRAGFPDEVQVGAKTGSLPGIRNEAGVIEFPDGSRYVVAVFTRAESFADVLPEIDRLIGDVAAVAVAALR